MTASARARISTRKIHKQVNSNINESFIQADQAPENMSNPVDPEPSNSDMMHILREISETNKSLARCTDRLETLGQFPTVSDPEPNCQPHIQNQQNTHSLPAETINMPFEKQTNTQNTAAAFANHLQHHQTMSSHQAQRRQPDSQWDTILPDLQVLR